MDGEEVQTLTPLTHTKSHINTQTRTQNIHTQTRPHPHEIRKAGSLKSEAPTLHAHAHDTFGLREGMLVGGQGETIGTVQVEWGLLGQVHTRVSGKNKPFESKTRNEGVK